jgi:hypothetical protein
MAKGAPTAELARHLSTAEMFKNHDCRESQIRGTGF